MFSTLIELEKKENAALKKLIKTIEAIQQQREEGKQSLKKEQEELEEKMKNFDKQAPLVFSPNAKQYAIDNFEKHRNSWTYLNFVENFFNQGLSFDDKLKKLHEQISDELDKIEKQYVIAFYESLTEEQCQEWLQNMCKQNIKYNTVI